MSTIDQWLAAHPVARGVLWTALVFVAINAFGAWFNWVMWKPTEAEWQAYKATHPRRAYWLGVSRIALPHLRKLPQLKTYFDAAEKAQKENGSP